MDGDKHLSRDVKALLKKYLAGSCTPDEERLVDTWFRSLGTAHKSLPDEETYHKAIADTKAEILRVTSGNLPGRHSFIFRRRWLQVAAALLAVITVSIYLFVTQRSADPLPTHAAVVPDSTGIFKNDILSGGYFAKLHYPNGKVQTFAGLVNSGRPLHESKLVPDDSPGTLQLTLEVPKTGTYQLTLEDGSMVWLNAESSLRYPDKFGPDERRVVLTGEAFFEVAPDTERPFRVTIGDGEVEALGTSFNIQAYHAEISATLVSGSIRVTHRDLSSVLSPGQAAFYQAGKLDVKAADTKKETAWKAGEFYFRNDPITNIMEELARWYDLTIIYRGSSNHLKSERYSGSMSRAGRLSEALLALNTVTGLDFEIDNRTVYVTLDGKDE